MSSKGDPGTVARLSREEVEARVLEIVGDLALEVGGSRARRAVAAGASLERDIGLGSLERVELLLRLESALGGRFGDEMLQLDTPAALADASAPRCRRRRRCRPPRRPTRSRTRCGSARAPSPIAPTCTSARTTAASTR